MGGGNYEERERLGEEEEEVGRWGRRRERQIERTG